MKNEILRLVVFNEDYWSKGLIYTQNILPFKKLADKHNKKLELISFTSLLMYLRNKKKIDTFKGELANDGITVRNFFTLYYPTRYLLTRWFMLPFFDLNVFAYVKYLQGKDKGKSVVYNLRSYQASLAFLRFYRDKSKLVFDPRTDWIEENMNAGYFKAESKTVAFWNRIEEKMIGSYKKTIVISDTFRDNLLKKYDKIDPRKVVIVYNPIDYSHFSKPHLKHDDAVFLYTGSLGQWNRLENYLEVFVAYNKFDSNCRMVICTNASKNKVESILISDEFREVAAKVEVHYNVLFSELPSYYSMCDYGMQIMSKVDSRVGVKFIEYIASGITPIVNKNVQGAALLAKKYNIGVVLNGDENQEQIYKKIIECKRIDVNDDNYSQIMSQTDIHCVAEQLLNVYFHE